MNYAATALGSGTGEGHHSTIGDLAVEWLENKEQYLKPSSFAPLQTAWRVYVAPRWGKIKTGEVRPSEVENWVRELALGHAPTARVRSKDGVPRSPSVVLRSVGILAGILDVAVRDGVVSVNAARGLSNLPRTGWRPRRPYLTHEQVFQFAAAAPDEMRATLILTLAYTGIRWGEAIGLTVDDVDVITRKLRIRRTVTEVDGRLCVGAPKSWQARTVPFPALLDAGITALVTTGGPGAPLFRSAAGGFLRRPDTAKGKYSWWLTALNHANLPHLTPHDLRHTAASLAVSAGANVKVLQRVLGHRSAAMTLDVYAELFEEDLSSFASQLNDRAVEANGFVGSALRGEGGAGLQRSIEPLESRSRPL
ncbi:tyrosine-type recombinase/integrase [Leifsonia aquatica]|uniref:tyrosine-type recombinase/integrase n=1 Tax=Leifsonia aquatica TaxID=144185 RepID=UPI0038291C52